MRHSNAVFVPFEPAAVAMTTPSARTVRSVGVDRSELGDAGGVSIDENHAQNDCSTSHQAWSHGERDAFQSGRQQAPTRRRQRCPVVLTDAATSRVRLLNVSPSARATVATASSPTATTRSASEQRRHYPVQLPRRRLEAHLPGRRHRLHQRGFPRLKLRAGVRRLPLCAVAAGTRRRRALRTTLARVEG